jgi:biopolymer transport protein ExbD
VAGTIARGRGRGKIIGINVTPMVDVVLVLLVIMMVSATYIVAQSLKVELPKTASSDEPAASPAVVTITKDSKTYFNDVPVTEPQLIAKLKEASARSPDDVNLVVSADRDVKHGDVVHVIDVAKVVGITKFAINVERTE